MQHRLLCSEGPEVSALGFGAWPIGEGMGHLSERDAVRTVHSALDAGITLIDSAEAYQKSEERIGKALAEGRRNRCFLATKASFDFSQRGITQALEKSLKALKTDVIDLYQIHTWLDEYPIWESMEALAKAQEAGKVRYIGVSNFSSDHMSQARKVHPFHTNQLAYNLFNRRIEERDVAFCRKHGIGILAHSPLDKGLLTGKYTPDHRFPEEDERSTFPRFQGKLFGRYLEKADRLKEIAHGKGLSLVQMAVAWTLRLPEVATTLVGAKSPEQVEEHVRAAEVGFREAELAEIAKIVA